jgi:hypothetical protein
VSRAEPAEPVRAAGAPDDLSQRRAQPDRRHGDRANQVLANSITAALGGDRELTVIAGPGAPTDFVIDITGYYL